MRTRTYRILNKRNNVNREDYLTDELLNTIVNSNSLSSIAGMDLSSDDSLGEYLTRKLDEKGLKRTAVVREAQINETHGYQIFKGQRKASRNKILALCIAMGLDLHDTRLALLYGNVGDLYPKNRRDAIIIFCVERGYSLSRTDESLYGYGEETVSDAGDK